MQKQMASPLSYMHEEGIYYSRVAPDIIVGSCLQTAADVDRLAEQEGVKLVFCLQEDSDLRYWRLDINAIQQRCQERGVSHSRFPIRDFDGHDLRRKLPEAIAKLAAEHDPQAGTVYIHCTAGLGRAPATAVAYMAWIRGEQVDRAMEHVKTVRPCNPRIEAVRAATADLVLHSKKVSATIALKRDAASSVKVAGLHGWDKPHMDMEWDEAAQRFHLPLQLRPGTYRYKFLVDGRWQYCKDLPTVQDGHHINNVLRIQPELHPELSDQHKRLSTPGTVLAPDERRHLRKALLKEEAEKEEAEAEASSVDKVVVEQPAKAEVAKKKHLCTIM